MSGATSRVSISSLGIVPVLFLACGDGLGPDGGRVAVRLLLDLQDVAPVMSVVPAESLAIGISREGEATPVVDTLVPFPQDVAAVDILLSVPLDDESGTFSLAVSALTDTRDTVFISTPETVALSTDDVDPVPVNFTLRFAWEALDAGEFVTCALAAGGRAFCWGFSSFGQLGGGVMGADTSATPAPVVGDLRFSRISVGGVAACGIVKDGGATFCWGTDQFGTLGDGLPAGPGVLRSEPGPVAGDITLSSVSVGFDHACGIGTDGTPFCWGNNAEGQLGAESSDTCDGFPCSAAPIEFSAVANVRRISAGVGATCVLDDSGTSHCSVLDDPAVGFQTAVAPNGSSFERVSAGGLYQCALTNNQAGSCWGKSNVAGQLGVGDTGGRDDPSPLSTIGALRMITASSANAVLSHSCAVTLDGEAYCWGWAGHGQLGAPAAGACLFGREFVPCHTSPLAVDTTLRFTTLTVGFRHTCGMTTGRRLFCWGANDGGQLGNGTLTSSTGPVEVLPPGS